LDLSYPLVPQKYSYIARTDRQLPIPKGRVFGGSSSINSMNYYRRESREYFHLWNTLFGIKKLDIL
jgi:choline dehydrogenase-like flavoprotein